MTVWSDGQLNMRRCSPTALALLNPSLTQLDIRRLIEARDALYNKNPQPTSGQQLLACRK